jgi:hypothetical protein
VGTILPAATFREQRDTFNPGVWRTSLACPHKRVDSWRKHPPTKESRAACHRVLTNQFNERTPHCNCVIVEAP